MVMERETMLDIDSDELCRLCLADDGEMVYIFDPKGYKGYLVWEIIKELLQLEVSREDGLPGTVCLNCLKKVTEFKYFKTICIKSKISILTIIAGRGIVGDCSPRESRSGRGRPRSRENPPSFHPAPQLPAAASETIGAGIEPELLEVIDDDALDKKKAKKTTVAGRIDDSSSNNNGDKKSGGRKKGRQSQRKKGNCSWGKSLTDSLKNKEHSSSLDSLPPLPSVAAETNGATDEPEVVDVIEDDAVDKKRSKKTTGVGHNDNNNGDKKSSGRKKGNKSQRKKDGHTAKPSLPAANGCQKETSRTLPGSRDEPELVEIVEDDSAEDVGDAEASNRHKEASKNRQNKDGPSSGNSSSANRVRRDEGPSSAKRSRVEERGPAVVVSLKDTEAPKLSKEGSVSKISSHRKERTKGRRGKDIQTSPVTPLVSQGSKEKECSSSKRSSLDRTEKGEKLVDDTCKKDDAVDTAEENQPLTKPSKGRKEGSKKRSRKETSGGRPSKMSKRDEPPTMVDEMKSLPSTSGVDRVASVAKSVDALREKTSQTDKVSQTASSASKAVVSARNLRNDGDSDKEPVGSAEAEFSNDMDDWVDASKGKKGRDKGQRCGANANKSSLKRRGSIRDRDVSEASMNIAPGALNFIEVPVMRDVIDVDRVEDAVASADPLAPIKVEPLERSDPSHPIKVEPSESNDPVPSVSQLQMTRAPGTGYNLAYSTLGTVKRERVETSMDANMNQVPSGGLTTPTVSPLVSASAAVCSKVEKVTIVTREGDMEFEERKYSETLFEFTASAQDNGNPLQLVGDENEINFIAIASQNSAECGMPFEVGGEEEDPFADASESGNMLGELSRDRPEAVKKITASIVAGMPTKCEIPSSGVDCVTPRVGESVLSSSVKGLEFNAAEYSQKSSFNSDGSVPPVQVPLMVQSSAKGSPASWPAGPSDGLNRGKAVNPSQQFGPGKQLDLGETVQCVQNDILQSMKGRDAMFIGSKSSKPSVEKKRLCVVLERLDDALVNKAGCVNSKVRQRKQSLDDLGVDLNAESEKLNSSPFTPDNSSMDVGVDSDDASMALASIGEDYTLSGEGQTNQTVEEVTGGESSHCKSSTRPRKEKTTQRKKRATLDKSFSSSESEEWMPSAGSDLDSSVTNSELSDSDCEDNTIARSAKTGRKKGSKQPVTNKPRRRSALSATVYPPISYKKGESRSTLREGDANPGRTFEPVMSDTMNVNSAITAHLGVDVQRSLDESLSETIVHCGATGNSDAASKGSLITRIQRLISGGYAVAVDQSKRDLESRLGRSTGENSSDSMMTSILTNSGSGTQDPTLNTRITAQQTSEKSSNLEICQNSSVFGQPVIIAKQNPKPADDTGGNQQKTKLTTTHSPQVLSRSLLKAVQNPNPADDTSSTQQKTKLSTTHSPQVLSRPLFTAIKYPKPTDDTGGTHQKPKLGTTHTSQVGNSPDILLRDDPGYTSVDGMNLHDIAQKLSESSVKFVSSKDNMGECDNRGKSSPSLDASKSATPGAVLIGLHHTKPCSSNGKLAAVAVQVTKDLGLPSLPPSLNDNPSDPKSSIIQNSETAIPPKESKLEEVLGSIFGKDPIIPEKTKGAGIVSDKAVSSEGPGGSQSAMVVKPAELAKTLTMTSEGPGPSHPRDGSAGTFNLSDKEVADVDGGRSVPVTNSSLEHSGTFGIPGNVELSGNGGHEIVSSNNDHQYASSPSLGCHKSIDSICGTPSMHVLKKVSSVDMAKNTVIHFVSASTPERAMSFVKNSLRVNVPGIRSDGGKNVNLPFPPLAKASEAVRAVQGAGEGGPSGISDVKAKSDEACRVLQTVVPWVSSMQNRPFMLLNHANVMSSVSKELANTSTNPVPGSSASKNILTASLLPWTLPQGLNAIVPKSHSSVVPRDGRLASNVIVSRELELNNLPHMMSQKNCPAKVVTITHHMESGDAVQGRMPQSSQLVPQKVQCGLPVQSVSLTSELLDQISKGIMLKCKWCSDLITSKQELTLHLNSKHYDEIAKLTKPSKENSVGNRSVLKSILKSGGTTSSSTEEVIVISDSEDSKRCPTSPEPGTFKCRYCPEVFIYKSLLKNHKKIFHSSSHKVRSRYRLDQDQNSATEKSPQQQSKTVPEYYISPRGVYMNSSASKSKGGNSSGHSEASTSVGVKGTVSTVVDASVGNGSQTFSGKAPGTSSDSDKIGKTLSQTGASKPTDWNVPGPSKGNDEVSISNTPGTGGTAQYLGRHNVITWLGKPAVPPTSVSGLEKGIDCATSVMKSDPGKVSLSGSPKEDVANNELSSTNIESAKTSTVLPSSSSSLPSKDGSSVTCDYTATSSKELLSRFLVHEVKVIRCPKCSISFRTILETSRHLVEFHKVSLEDIQIEARDEVSGNGERLDGGSELREMARNDPKECKMCTLKFDSYFEYKNHFGKVHMPEVYERQKQKQIDKLYKGIGISDQPTVEKH